MAGSKVLLLAVALAAVSGLAAGQCGVQRCAECFKNGCTWCEDDFFESYARSVLLRCWIVCRNLVPRLLRWFAVCPVNPAPLPFRSLLSFLWS